MNTAIFVMISLTFFTSDLASIRKRNAAAWICSVAVGRNKDSRIVIRS